MATTSPLCDVCEYHCPVVAKLFRNDKNKYTYNLRTVSFSHAVSLEEATYATAVCGKTRREYARLHAVRQLKRGKVYSF